MGAKNVSRVERLSDKSQHELRKSLISRILRLCELDKLNNTAWNRVAKSLKLDAACYFALFLTFKNFSLITKQMVVVRDWRMRWPLQVLFWIFTVLQLVKHFFFIK